MDVKVLEPVKKPLREFETVKEFESYYTTHKCEIDGETTNKLNKKYPIKGYRITRIKGVLCLKKDYGQQNKLPKGVLSECERRSEKADQNFIETFETNDSIPNLEKRVRYLEETLNQLIAHLEKLS